MRRYYEHQEEIKYWERPLVLLRRCVRLHMLVSGSRRRGDIWRNSGERSKRRNARPRSRLSLLLGHATSVDGWAASMVHWLRAVK